MQQFKPPGLGLLAAGWILVGVGRGRLCPDARHRTRDLPRPSPGLPHRGPDFLALRWAWSWNWSCHSLGMARHRIHRAAEPSPGALLLATRDDPSAGNPGGLRPRARRARTIVLLGTDGAGKTTTAAALAAAERTTGRTAVVLRNRSGRRWLIRSSHRLGMELPVSWADRVETMVRTVNVLLSHARAGRTDRLGIMDRHLACQLVLRDTRGLPTGRLLPWLSARLLRTATVAVLDVPAETAKERILARAKDHETLEDLRAARAAYLDLARSRGWLVVDATGTTEAILAQLLDMTTH